jgi:putative hydrolase of the HAD superfamily
MATAVGADRAEFARLWMHDTARDRGTGVFKTMGDNVAAICRLLGLSPSQEGVARAEAIRCENTTDFLRNPRSDAVTTLDALRRKDLKLGLVSDCSMDVPKTWSQSPLASRLDVLVFSCVAGMRKPDPRIYLKACTALGVAPQRCLYVGDGCSHELTGARALGMRPVLLRASDIDRPLTPDCEVDTWDGESVGALGEVIGLVTA